jgi:hypothetical protein
MSDYNFYYPNRFRSKTRNFDNIFNEFKTIENSFGELPKQWDIIEKHFSKELSNEVKASKSTSFLEYRRFTKKGANIFHFRKELLEMLEKTEVTDIQLNSIKFPFDHFYISLRELNKQFSSSNSDDSIIDGVYIHFHDESEEDTIYPFWIDFYVCGYSEKNKDIEFNRTTIDSMELASSLTFTSKEATIKDAIELIHQIMNDTLENKNLSKEAREKEIDFQLEEYKRLTDNLSLFINCILYISLDQPDIETKFVEGLPTHLKTKIDKANTKHRREIAENEVKGFGYSKICLVGNSYIKDKKTDGIKLDIAPHWRRGHWRNQPFGEKLLEKKLIWIKPTVVNKEKGEPTKGHIYTTE